jgi:hypothetical protein
VVVEARREQHRVAPKPPAVLAPVVEPETEPIPAAAPWVPAAGGPVRTSLAEESAALTEALTTLRAQHDPAHALELLSNYNSRFPNGTLRVEASVATVEAHRALGHTSEARAALDALPSLPELDVLRAELDAELGRCESARAVLKRLATPDGPLRERALFTDAACALTLGDRDAAAAELRQLPDSERARALLEKLR